MSVLQRKAQAGKREHQARAVTVPKALRISIAKVADELFDMALVQIGFSRERIQGDEIAGALEENALLVLMDGPPGVTAGVVVGPELVRSLVQQQTTGRVDAPGTSVKLPTSTDAALCAPVLDRLFQRSNAMLDLQEERDLLRIFKFGARAENARLFELALGAGEFEALRLTVDIAGGLAQSALTLLLPLPGIAPDNPDEEVSEIAESAHPETLKQAAMSLQTELSAILCRQKMPLSKVGSFAVGDVLPVPSEAFESVSLLTVEGKSIACGVMGQVDGYRALQIRAPAGISGGGLRSETAPGSPDIYDVNTSPAMEPIEQVPDATEPDFAEVPDFPSSAAEVAAETSPDAELPDLPDLPESSAGPGDLPDLPLPEGLGDIPDIDDLPKLNTA